MQQHDGFAAHRYTCKKNMAKDGTECYDAFCAVIGGEPEFESLRLRLIAVIGMLTDEKLIKILLASFNLLSDYKDLNGVIARRKECGKQLGIKSPDTIADRATEGIDVLADLLSKKVVFNVSQSEIIKKANETLARYENEYKKEAQQDVGPNQDGSEKPPKGNQKDTESFNWWEHIDELNKNAAFSSFAVGSQLESLDNRDNELTFLNEFCKKSTGHLLVRGDAFHGKSSLLSWFFLHPPEDTIVTGFFIRKDVGEQKTSQAMIHALYQQFLPWLKKRDILDWNPYTEEELKASLLQPLEDAAKTAKRYQKKLILVIDALDEDMSADNECKGIIEFLPKQDIDNLIVIISCRPNPDVIETYSLPCETYDINQTTNLREIQAKVLYELEQFKGNTIAEDVLSLLAVCSGALTKNDLIEIVKPQKSYYISDIFTKSTARMFSAQTRSAETTEQAYRFSHISFKDQVDKDFVGKNFSQYENMIFSWCDSYKNQNWPDNTPVYLLSNYQNFLLNGKSWERLSGLFFDDEYFSLAVKKTSNFFNYNTKNIFARVLDELAQHEEKKNNCHAALKAYKRILELLSDDNYYKRRYAETLYMCQRKNEAISEFSHIIDFCKANRDYKEIAVCYGSLGDLFYNSKQPQIALLMYFIACFLAKTRLNKETYRASYVWDRLCFSIANYSSNYEEALKISQISFLEHENEYGLNNFRTLFRLLRIAEYCAKLKLQSQAKIYVKRVESLFGSLTNLDEEDEALYYGQLGYIYARLNKFPLAEEHFHLSLALRKKASASNEGIAEIMLELGKNYYHQDKYHEASKSCTEALETLGGKENNNNRLVNEAIFLLAKISVEEKDYAAAIEYLYDVERRFLASLYPYHRDFAELYDDLAICCANILSKEAEVEKYRCKARDIRESAVPYAVLKNDFSAGTYIERYFQYTLLPDAIKDAVKFSKYDPVQMILKSINQNCDALCGKIDLDFCKDILSSFSFDDENDVLVVKNFFYHDFHTDKRYCPLSKLDDSKRKDRLFELGLIFDDQRGLPFDFIEERPSDEQQKLDIEHPMGSVDISVPTKNHPPKNGFIRIDYTFLQEAGLDSLSDEWKQPILQSIHNQLECHVGDSLTKNMSDELSDEFGYFVDKNENEMRKWFGKYLPDYESRQDFRDLMEENPNKPYSSLLSEYGAMKWLQLNRSNSSLVVIQVLKNIKSELSSRREEILRFFESR